MHQLAKTILAPAISVLILSSPASAQPQQTVAIASVAEEGLSESSRVTLRSQVSDELDRLQIRLQASAPNQTPGTLTTTTAELEGRVLADSMRHVLVVQPQGKPVLIGIEGQVSENGARQLVLFNLSSWIDHGRTLDPNHSAAFAILDDEKIRGASGAAFQVEGVNYLALAESTSIAFHRAH